MKLKHTFIGITAGLILSSSALALSSSYPFKTSIAPGATFKMPTEKLYAGPSYEITCKIADQEVRRQDFNAIKIISSNLVDMSIDDITYKNSYSFVAKTKMNGSQVKISPVSKTSTLTLTNFDFSDSISVDCVASVHEGSSR